MDDAPKPELHPVRIRIKNFQSIEDLEIEVRGFTCITGRTNAGKSAIIRAISGAILGDSVIGMVRKGTPYCSVEISSESWGFKWEKGERGINRYIIDGVTHDKPGQRQIDEISRMGFGSVKLGNKEVQPWLASQFFPIFLLNESGPAITDFISEVSRLTVLQDAITLSSRGKRQANDDAKDKAEEAQKLRDKLVRVSSLDAILKLQKELEEQQESIREYEKRINTGEVLEAKLKLHSRRVAALTPIDSVVIPKNDAQELYQQIVSMHGFWVRLERHAKKIIVLKPSEKVQVPELPTKEYEELVALQRFAGIDRMKKRVKILEKIRDVEVPDIGGMKEELNRVRSGESLERRLSRSRRVLQTFSTKVNVPEIPPDLEELRKGEKLARRLQISKAEIEKLNAENLQLDRVFKEVLDKIAAIPACSSCGRPVASKSHKHEHTLSH